MDTLLSMKVFCQVVQSGSFTRAAKLLDISTPMASKHVAHLEREIQVQLLYRNNRHLKLTEQGETYYRECVLALDILQQAANQVAVGRMQPKGTLRVSIPLWFSCDKFAQLIQEYHTQFPEVELVLSLSNRLVDLNGDGEDLALRMSHRLADNVVAKKLMEMNFYLVAAPNYLAQYGLPEKMSDLLQYNAVLPSYTDLSQTKIKYRGEHVALQLNGKIRTDNTSMTAELVRAGLGIGYVPTWLINDDLAAGRLVRLLPEYEIEPVPLYAVYANRRYMNATARSFIDFLVQKLQTESF